MQPGTYLDHAVSRVPLAGHVGKSGARLERVRLADGRRLVVKRLDPSSDLIMALSEDTAGRELQVWRAGLLDRLPEGVGHAVVDGWRDDGGAVLVMRDLGGSVLTWDDRLTGPRWRFVLERVAALHRAFLGHAPEGLTPLHSCLGLFSPARVRPHLGDDNQLPPLVLRGWERFEQTVPKDVAEPALGLLDDLRPLERALAARPATLVHGDLATVNMALEGPQLTLLDWSMPTAAPGAMDLARFVAGCSSVVDGTREELLEGYRLAAGEAYDGPALDLALLAALLWLGWNKALDATEHPDPVVRAREREDLRWWVDRTRRALEAGLL